MVVSYILLRYVNIFLWNTSLSFHCCSLVPHSSVIGNIFLNYFSRLLTLLVVIGVTFTWVNYWCHFYYTPITTYYISNWKKKLWKMLFQDLLLTRCILHNCGTWQGSSICIFFSHLIYGGQWTLRMFSTFLSNSTINFFLSFGQKLTRFY